MLKVAYFSPVSDLKGGAETSLVDLLNNPNVNATLVVPAIGDLSKLAEKLGRTAVVVPFGRVSQIRRPVRLGNVFPAVLDWIKAAITLRKLASLHHFDVIHSNGLKAHFVASLCRVFGGPPIVIHVHDIPLQRRERWLWRLLGFFGDLILIVSRPCWPTNGALPRNVKVLFNGLDATNLPRLESAATQELTVGFCGRLHPYKGVNHLIEWVAYLRREGRPVRLVIRGEGAAEHADYVSHLHREARRLGIADSVMFEGKKHGLKEIYQGIDIVAVPSVVPDALPRSIMEAMGLGLLVVAYPSGGIVYQIDDGVDGFLVTSAEEFHQVVNEVIDNPAAIEEIRLRAALKVQSSFTIEKMYAALMRYYDAL